MKLKNFLIESGYWLGMIVALWLATWDSWIVDEPTDQNFLLVFGWVTDSIKWVATDTTFEGDCKCEHDWIYSELQKSTLRIGDAIYMKNNHVLACADGYHPTNSAPFIKPNYPSHEPEEHCPYEVMEREKICRKCLRGVIESEKWFQRYVAPPKSEFEILKEKQRAKQ